MLVAQFFLRLSGSWNLQAGAAAGRYLSSVLPASCRQDETMRD